MGAGSLQGKRIVISGASRGIGLAIALRAAQDGAQIAIFAKSERAHPKLEGTIHSAAKAIKAAGGTALPLKVDIRDENQITQAVDQVVTEFGGIDIAINNASALSLTPTLDTKARRFDLMHQVNTRGTFMLSQAVLPHLKQADNPHLLMIAPPLDMRPIWFAPHLAYSIAKYGMSLCVLGLAEEFKANGIAVNALWPRTTIATAAIQNVLGGDAMMRQSRSPQIMADAAHDILTRPAAERTGHFLIDDLVLHDAGIRDFDRYRVDPSQSLQLDFMLPEDLPMPDAISLDPIG